LGYEGIQHSKHIHTKNRGITLPKTTYNSSKVVQGLVQDKRIIN